jgi:hypothetical protein
LFGAHVSGHFLTWENALRVHRADRPWTAIAAATMGFAAAVEVMALNCASPAFTFAGAGYIYNVANTKKIGA